ncbi:MAG: RICIN domain-containing protein [Burkholderiales bacterium]
MSLIALGSVTHSFNNTQRRIPLTFTQTDNIVTATLPANANLAPPGYYMVFAVDANGVPSRGTIIGLGDVPSPALPDKAAGSVLPTGAVACANEGGTCNVPAGQKATLYFGANGIYTARTGQTGAVACDNATFGDRLPGAGKTCFYSVVPQVVPAVDAPLIAAGGSASYTVQIPAGATATWNFGDGSTPTSPLASPSVTHAYSAPGVYAVTLTVNWGGDAVSSRDFLQAVYAQTTAGAPVASSAVALEPRAYASTRLWVANPDADTVAVIDTATNARVAEISVGTSPRSVAVAPDGRLWVTNKGSASISIVDPATLMVMATVALPRASQPHGLAFAPGGSAFVVLEATGQLLKLDAASGATQATLAVGNHPRHLSATADGATVLVSRFITDPLPGESTATVDTTTAGAEVLAVDAGAMTLNKTIVLRHSDRVDGEAQGSGIPNYLAAAVVSPDGKSAWVPSKQDNIKRGLLRSGQGLTFQNAVRAISSRIDLTTLDEDYARRIDHDNSSLGSAAAFHPKGTYLFVALETSRQVAVVDAVNGRELAKVDVGRAPQALKVSDDGMRLYVQNYMDRTVSVLDLTPLLTLGQLNLPVMSTIGTVGTEKLSAHVLLGKQLFYDARDPRLARDSYMSCASCHSDAGHDGRTWDFTGFGEGLRNTIALNGRAGTGHGMLHWSDNFDEVQDFEGQIRSFAGGTGLMTDAQFNAGTRNQPLGDAKAGVSADLDALAAYLGSLTRFAPSPYRNVDGNLTPTALAGKAAFANAKCASCHSDAGFTMSANAASLRNIGTLKPSSGKRLDGTLTGIDVPTLRDVWMSAPYLHDGSAETLQAAVRAHAGTSLAGADLDNLVAYLRQIGSEEAGPGTRLPPSDGVYRLMAVHSGQALDIAGASKTVGAQAIQWLWLGGENQHWKISSLSDGDYALTAQHSGQRLELFNAGLLNSDRVQQGPADAGRSQAWRIEPLSDGSYRLVNSHSGKVLDVSGASRIKGATVSQYSWTGANNQRWRVEPVSVDGPVGR